MFEHNYIKSNDRVLRKNEVDTYWDRLLCHKAPSVAFIGTLSGKTKERGNI